MKEQILDHLAALVACDTQNPPRDIKPEHSIFAHINGVLDRAGGFDIEVTDHGQGRISYLARRGDPKLLFNVHLDTVPVGNGWKRSPLEVTIEHGRAYGRGVCDIKGAAACLLTLAQQCKLPMAMLFTTDEEGASGCCVSRFTESLAPSAYQMVVVAEPTLCQAILAHRGYLSVLGEFSGEPGHSSEPRALKDSALHQACVWAAAAVQYADKHQQEGPGLCFNLGTMRGGSASNVIADIAHVHWSARLAPGSNTDHELRTLTTLTPAASRVDWNARFAGPPLPGPGQTEQAGSSFAAAHGLEVGDPVAFWTEASLFSAANQPAIVLGPGNIEQAHTDDEWVALDQLWKAASIYQRLIEASEA